MNQENILPVFDDDEQLLTYAETLYDGSIDDKLFSATIMHMKLLHAMILEARSDAILTNATRNKNITYCTKMLCRVRGRLRNMCSQRTKSEPNSY